MSDSTSSSQPINTAAVSATPGAPTGARSAAEANASTKVSSMADLEKKAPEVAQAMKEGLAFRIIGDMKRHNDRLKELMREQREQNG